jgi:hypothetical protein
MELGPLFWAYWFGMALAIAIIAGQRNRCGTAWLMLGLLANLLALAVLMWLPPKEVEDRGSR